MTKYHLIIERYVATLSSPDFEVTKSAAWTAFKLIILYAVQGNYIEVLLWIRYAVQVLRSYSSPLSLFIPGQYSALTGGELMVNRVKLLRIGLTIIPLAIMLAGIVIAGFWPCGTFREQCPC